MTATVEQIKHHDMPRPIVIPIAMLWNIVILVGSVFVAQRIFATDTIIDVRDLGTPVQYFLALAALLPGAAAVYSTYHLFQDRPNGRLMAMGINYVGMVLASFMLLKQWGVFIGFDVVSQKIFENAQWLLGIALAYAIFYIAGRIDEDSLWHDRIEKLSLGIGMLSLLLLLITANAIDGAMSILNTYSNINTWFITGAVIVFGVLAWMMKNTGEYFGETPAQRSVWEGWLFLSPNLIGFMIFFAGPLLLSFYLAFTNSTGVTVPDFVGLGNYQEILGLQFRMQDDPTLSAQQALDRGFVELTTINLGDNRLVVGARDALFWLSLRNTLLFVILVVPLAGIPALGLAMILNSKLPGMKFYRAIFFLPSVAAVVGTALIWRNLYNVQVGFINYTISEIIQFVNSTFGANWHDPRIQWLSDPNFQLISIVILGAWTVMGFNTVLFLAGLQGIPKSLYEAAYVDGANGWQRFRNVTVPMLAPTTFFVVITTVINGLQVFNEPFTLISSRPMPVNASTAVYYLYTRGFERFEFGYASSVAWIVFIIIFAVTLLQFRFSRSTAYED
ncbi:MAG: sugar ABC transporter permease [Chloroflexi bacterium]|nr:MAG: hypothetical protein CUN54_06235 [Phototrophicales bacterium]RMF78938.1 MAG: sugar ABC transporter permease [Chloroflexota bacterium]